MVKRGFNKRMPKQIEYEFDEDTALITIVGKKGELADFVRKARRQVGMTQAEFVGRGFVPRLSLIR